jgi:TRAP-type C4-dicarboxylate transport system substrate-binding protein
MKRGLFIAGIMAIIVCFLAIPMTSMAQTKGKELRWRLSTTMPPDSDRGVRAKAFAKEVKEKTNGRIDITVYHDSVLGDWVEENELVMRGAIEMALDPFAPTYDPRLNIAYYLPYVAETVEKAKKVYSRDGIIFKLVSDMVRPMNIVPLAIYPVGTSGCTLSKVPPSPGDPNVAKNMKIRVMPMKLCELTWKRLGYLPTAIPWAEVYSALQTGVADGQMGGPPYQGFMVKDVQKCWIQYNDFFETLWFYMGKKAWDGLNSNEKKIFVDAAQKQVAERWNGVVEEDNKYRDEMKKAGLEIIMLNDKELETCAQAIRKDVWPEMDNTVGKVIMNQIRAAVAAK